MWGRGWFGGDYLFNCRRLRNQHGTDDTDDGDSGEHTECPGGAKAGTNHKTRCHRTNDAAEATEASTPGNACGTRGGIKVVRGQSVGQNLGA